MALLIGLKKEEDAFDDSAAQYIIKELSIPLKIVRLVLQDRWARKRLREIIKFHLASASNAIFHGAIRIKCNPKDCQTKRYNRKAFYFAIRHHIK